jgi:alkanesulfonate monooxygenase SsuD/methylene tetrahydromethanopterin reductase-like flavin-dependent oxidoreductase (luciferase family)
VQKPHPRIYLAAFAPATLGRLARLADGWNPTGIRLKAWRKCFLRSNKWLRKPDATPRHSKWSCAPISTLRRNHWEKTAAFSTRMLEQIREDTADCRQMGAHEVHFEPGFRRDSSSLDRWLVLMEQLRSFV